MKTQITGKNVEISTTLKEYLSDKIRHIKKYFDNVIDVKIILNKEKYRNNVEITLHSKGNDFFVDHFANDMLVAIDSAMDKLEKQIKRFKGKHMIRGKKARAKHEQGFDYSMPQEEEDTSPRVIRMPANFLNKPMTIDEALLNLDLAANGLVVFDNADSGSVNVLFKRSDGHIGLVEPHR